MQIGIFAPPYEMIWIQESILSAGVGFVLALFDVFTLYSQLNDCVTLDYRR